MDREPPPESQGPAAPPLAWLLVTVLAIAVAESLGALLVAAVPGAPPIALRVVALALTALPAARLLGARAGRSRAAPTEPFGAARPACLDEPTQLLNRLALEVALDRALLRAQSAAHEVTLVALDLRGFHQINEALGTKLGDALLRQVAERLRSGRRESELVARLGGDVFAVALPSSGGRDAAAAAARVHAMIEGSFVLADTPIEIEGHCGVACFPEHGRSAGELLQRAELALREAKEHGERSRVYAGADESAAARRVQLFGLLRLALQRGELSLRYQPKLSTDGDVIVGAEALLTWRQPQLGPISPAEFIPIAEQTSLIKPLTAWVLEEAIRQLSQWRREGLHTRVAVNLSARNLTDETLPGYIGALLEKWGVGPENLIAEITESAVLLDPERAGAVLEQLSSLGVALSLDDFGTGYSSLTYLRTLPARELKIDRSFVRDVELNADTAAIIRGLVTLAHDLDLRVVAEGVETESASQRLRELGCDILQGYLISRPLTADGFVEFLEAHRRRRNVQPRPVERHLAISPRIHVRARSVPPLRESLRAIRASVRTGHQTSDAPVE